MKQNCVLIKFGIRKVAGDLRRRLNFKTAAHQISGDVYCLMKLTVLFSRFSVSYQCHLHSVMLPKYHDSSHEPLIDVYTDMPMQVVFSGKKIIKDPENKLIAVELSFA